MLETSMLHQAKSLHLSNEINYSGRIKMKCKSKKIDYLISHIILLYTQHLYNGLRGRIRGKRLK